MKAFALFVLATILVSASFSQFNETWHYLGEGYAEPNGEFTRWHAQSLLVPMWDSKNDSLVVLPKIVIAMSRNELTDKQVSVANYCGIKSQKIYDGEGIALSLQFKPMPRQQALRMFVEILNTKPLGLNVVIEHIQQEPDTRPTLPNIVSLHNGFSGAYEIGVATMLFRGQEPKDPSWEFGISYSDRCLLGTGFLSFPIADNFRFAFGTEFGRTASGRGSEGFVGPGASARYFIVGPVFVQARLGLRIDGATGTTWGEQGIAVGASVTF